jgi:predicted pyridoxine 5'-phosphate oxidase superfamily flavin-nucleotide-binding protein
MPPTELRQYIVGVSKGLVLRDIITQHIQKLFIQHHDQWIRTSAFKLGSAQLLR